MYSENWIKPTFNDSWEPKKKSKKKVIYPHVHYHINTILPVVIGLVWSALGGKRPTVFVRNLEVNWKYDAPMYVIGCDNVWSARDVLHSHRAAAILSSSSVQGEC